MSELTPATAPSRRRFTVGAVFAVYNVARYLPDLLASLERQTYPLTKTQLVFVDDGSTDDSLEVLRAWAVGREDHVVVTTQENAWVAAARNTGIRHLDAEWVTFADPDDVFDDRYFEEVVKFIDLHGAPRVGMLATHQMRLNEGLELINSHPLRMKFAKGSRIIDLEQEPVIQLAVNSAFFRTAEIERHGLEFDGRVRPVFEDAHFIGRYLLATGKNDMGVLASAKYHYRMRGDGTSLMETHFDHAGKYTDVLRYGLLDLLATAERAGGVPRWLENTVLYDLFWYFKNERALNSPSALAPARTFDEFHSLVAAIREKISDDAIHSFDIMWVEFAVRKALLTGYTGQSERPSYVKLERVDERRQHVKLTYWFTGTRPTERIVVDGRDVVPVHEKDQDLVFYGRAVLRQRHVWIERGRLTRIWLDGRVVPFSRGERYEADETLTRRQLNPQILGQRKRLENKWADVTTPALRHVKRAAQAVYVKTRKGVYKRKLQDTLLGVSVRTKRVRDLYQDAWVFMDRDTDANDNAEHLYRWVQRNRPDINAWFVLDAGSKDWDRLRAEGFRLVAYKSAAWRKLLLHAVHLASSHIDVYVVSPLDRRRYGEPRFTFTWLQHGVTNYDISRWVNSKPAELFVVVTPQEKASIAGDGPYTFTDREVVLTGFPRHDELLRKRRAVPDAERDLILIMPTWRKKLAGKQVPGSNERLKNPAFLTSQYAQQYNALIGSERIRDVAARTGKRVVFMPHPNMRPYLDDFDVPEWVEVWDFGSRNVQDVLARAALMITDYSSLGFEAAFLDVPLVYFQFDASSFFDGTHVGRRGYFDYERDGFGPVSDDVPGVEAAVEDIGLNDYVSAARYLDRTRAAFVTRDEQNSERVFRAMEALDGAPRIKEPTQEDVSAAAR
ncbi:MULTISPECIES: bifunctional glycosyltransferase/CDP-glycerol:glycerophosphate glycerophosphotransferase [unclassified Curtobacterium]|uniref:bifunctional glycosyltransferase/CDP-glycerol:glycerophosphate glycerophosphotransferase n=1 Tax=unclassified Curtobacterium TaxID=257496 RepID=UPI003A806051